MADLTTPPMSDLKYLLVALMLAGCAKPCPPQNFNGTWVVEQFDSTDKGTYRIVTRTSVPGTILIPLDFDTLKGYKISHVSVSWTQGGRP